MMKKKIVLAVLCLLLAVTAVLRSYADAVPGVQAAGVQDFDVPCAAAVLIDEDSGTVLYEKNADERRPVASITKVMTLLLTFEALQAGKIALGDIVPVSEHAYHMGGSQIWLEPGEQLTLQEMLKAICISSANDAAVAVAEFVAGSEPAFVDAMNARAAALGMTATHFANACGLDEEGHLSSARDVAVMSREMLLHHPEVREYCTVWMDTLRGGRTQLVNTNKLLKSYPGITGLKTGTTGKAGVCITASAERDGLRLIAVVLGASSGKERFEAAKTLLDYGFAHYDSAEVTLPDAAPEELPVKRGTAETTTLDYAAPERLLVPKGEGRDLQTKILLPDTLQAPVRQGSPVGSWQLLRGETVLQELPICAAQDVQALSFGYCLRYLVHTVLLGGA
ncbi:D-alanyl-D-alanine carboxypeptidase family protein [Gemmiger sp.]|uniref:D-alanyl-D-alanine carboxypeptidase family protein n=1 Tax=Gemmiger sp. TaxID=2049027 RepID=UPI002A749F11|nr:D-alanyl-D-alanine carboxypeptidase family protein [Gemmiger sp.]MDY2695014.1 D-alanyl-D-alanine carboxypeptidase family protein [Gemmiger sp.]